MASLNARIQPAKNAGCLLRLTKQDKTMVEYTIKIWNGKSWHIIPALRSCVESAKLMAAIGCLVSKRFDDVTVTCSLFRNGEIVNAFDYECGNCCGKLGIDQDEISNKAIITLYVD